MHGIYGDMFYKCSDSLNKLINKYVNPPKGSKYKYNLNGKTKVFESTGKEDKQKKFVNNMIKIKR